MEALKPLVIIALLIGAVVVMAVIMDSVGRDMANRTPGAAAPEEPGHDPDEAEAAVGGPSWPEDDPQWRNDDSLWRDDDDTRRRRLHALGEPPCAGLDGSPADACWPWDEHWRDAASWDGHWTSASSSDDDTLRGA
jgi:hypothetical protein